jgi:S1-C subfamily serine protease
MRGESKFALPAGRGSVMRYMTAVLLLVATMSAQNAPSTSKGGDDARIERGASGIKGLPDGCYEGDPKEIEGLPKGAIVCPLGTAERGSLKTQYSRHLDIPAISREANGAIVSIVMSDKDSHPIAKGSGFFISKDGRILTNYHVIKRGTSAVVKLPDGAFFAVDGVLAVDKDRDVAVIKAHGNDFRALTLGDSDRLQVGEEVVAIGNPLSLESTVSNGIVSAVRTIQTEGGKFLQITAPISPGSSGGPLFNMAGEVVGITTSHLDGGENLNFAIPINDVKLRLRSKVSTVRTLPDEVDEAENHEHSPSAGPDQFVIQEEGPGPPSGFAEAFTMEPMCSGLVLKRRTTDGPNFWVMRILTWRDPYKDRRRGSDGSLLLDPQGQTFIQWPHLVHFTGDTVDTDFDIYQFVKDSVDPNTVPCTTCTLPSFQTVKSVVKVVCTAMKRGPLGVTK